MVYLYNRLFNLHLDYDNKNLEGAKDGIIDISLELQNKKDAKTVNEPKIEESVIPKLESRQQHLYNQILKNIEINSSVDVILNKEIKQVIEFKNRKREEITFSSCESNYFIYCCYDQKVTSEKKGHKPKYELMMAAEKAIEQKTEIFEIWKIIDQLRLLLKVVLNDSQGFMIQHRGKQLITNSENISESSDIKDLEGVKFKRNKEKLIDYLKTRKTDNVLSEVDHLLIKYLDSEIKEEVIKETSIS